MAGCSLRYKAPVTNDQAIVIRVCMKKSESCCSCHHSRKLIFFSQMPSLHPEGAGLGNFLVGLAACSGRTLCLAADPVSHGAPVSVAEMRPV